MRVTPALVALSKLLLAIGFLDGVSAQATGGGNATVSNGTDPISPELQAELTNLELYYAYGRSPPVYPTRMCPVRPLLHSLTDVPQHRVQGSVTGLRPTSRLALSSHR